MMDFKALQELCRGLPGCTADIKWGADRCFSVGGKMFAVFDAKTGASFAFKANDIDFERLTKKPGIIPAPYAARFGWVSVRTRDAMTQAAAKKLIGAYRMILEKLPKRVRESVAEVSTKTVGRSSRAGRR